MHRFFSDALGERGALVRLAPEETHHLVKVLRAKPGDEVALFDGSGREAVARLRSVGGKRAEAMILSLRRAPRDVRVSVTVAVATPRGARMADLVRSCTEVGVDRIQPMVTERSVVKPRERGAPVRPGASERLVRVAREAARQSRRSHVPEIMPVADLDEVLEGARKANEVPAGTPAGYDFCVIADASPEAAELRRVLAEHGRALDVLVMIGPEGGFTPGELARAEASGCLRARLDCPIMRVETAATVVAAMVVCMCS